MSNTINLPRSTPEELGISSQAVIAFLNDITEKNQELHSFMLVRHGQVAAEGWWAPYQQNDPHLMFSLSKSFTSTAIGFAVSEGLISLDDRVIDFFPGDLPEDVSENLSAMQVRHLLMMGTGNANDTTELLREQAEGNWVKAFLAAPVEHAPGTHFVYNNGATYMLSAILYNVTGQFLLDYLNARLLAPLGISGATWEACPRGIAAGAFGLSIKTEDIARFGQLYLQEGIWDGAQLLPAGWVEEATSKHISNGDGGENDWTQGYGYQFWRCRHGAYRGDGAFGQFCIVMPEQDVVIAITAASNDMHGILDAVWTNLLPALEQAPLSGNQAAHEAMLEQLQELRIEAPAGQPTAVTEDRLEGLIYHLEPNDLELESISFRFLADEALLTFGSSTGDQTIRAGRGSWRSSKLRVLQGEAQKVETSFTWRDEATAEVTVRMVETPFTHTLTFQLAGDDLSIERKVNLNFGPTNLEPIQGKLTLLA